MVNAEMKEHTYRFKVGGLEKLSSFSNNSPRFLILVYSHCTSRLWHFDEDKSKRWTVIFHPLTPGKVSQDSPFAPEA